MTSAPEPGWTTRLLVGLAEHLHAAGAAVWLAPPQVYPPGTAGAVFLDQTPGTPDDVVVLSAYDVDADPALTDVVQGVQVRTRGASAHGARDRDDLVFDALHGLHDVELGGIPVVLVRRVSGAPIGLDANRRPERTSNYYAHAIRTSSHRAD